MAIVNILCSSLAVGLMLFAVANALSSAPSPYLKHACDYRKSGLYVYPYNCNKFISCSNGIAYLMDCAGQPSVTLLFRSSTQQCDWYYNLLPEEAAVCNYIERPAAVQSFCDSLSDGWYAYPYDCKKYVECLHHVALVRSCPESLAASPLYYNPDSGNCDYSDYVKSARIAQCSLPLPNPWVATGWGSGPK